MKILFILIIFLSIFPFISSAEIIINTTSPTDDPSVNSSFSDLVYRDYSTGQRIAFDKLVLIKNLKDKTYLLGFIVDESSKFTIKSVEAKFPTTTYQLAFLGNSFENAIKGDTITSKAGFDFTAATSTLLLSDNLKLTLKTKEAGNLTFILPKDILLEWKNLVRDY
ncbi:MAG: hypothetical protein PHO70_02170 [Candidatus Omnitrophica bacterium]|nr:hypothetical protein [Candidatus Omnitrophota bacterium]